MKRSKDARRTRKVEGRQDFTCPVHGETVEKRVRWSRDRDDRPKFAGEYLSCPHYSECRYYVSGDMRVPLVRT